MKAPRVPDHNEGDPVAQIVAALGDNDESDRRRRIWSLIAGWCGAKRILTITEECGTIWEQTVFPKLSEPTAENPQTEEHWNLARAGTRVSGKLLFVPVRQPVADPVSDRRTLAVLVLEVPDSSDELSCFLSQGSNLAALAQFVNRELRDIALRRYTGSRRRLATQQNSITSTQNFCYHVLREIRSLIRYDDSCSMLSLASVSPLKLNMLARLLPKPAKDKIVGPRELTINQGLSSSVLDYDAFVSSLPKGSSHFRHLGVFHSPGGKSAARVVEKAPLLDALYQALGNAGLISGQSILVLPLVSRHALVGLITISSSKPSAFSMDQVLAARDLANYAVPPLARDIRFEAELRLLEDTSRMAPETPLQRNGPLQTFLSHICERIRVHRAADFVVLIPYDPNSGTMQLDLVAHAGETSLNISTNALSDGGVLQHVLNVSEFEWHRSHPSLRFSPESFVEQHSVESFFAVALTNDKEISATSVPVRQPIGVLFIDYRRPKGKPKLAMQEFSDEDKRWIRFYAGILQQYLALHDRIARRFDTASAIDQVYKRLAHAEDLSSTLEEILRTGMPLVGATAGVFAVPCSEHHDLRILCDVGVSVATQHIAYHQGVTGECAARLAPILIPDSANRATWPDGVQPLPWVKSSRSELAVPLVAGDGTPRLVGVLDVESQVSTAAFGVRDRQALEQLAEASVIAIELTHRLQQLESLRSLGDKFKSAEADQSFLRIIIDEAVRITGAHSASARILDPTQSRLESVYRSGPEGRWSRDAIPPNAGAVGWAFTNQRPCIIDDIADSGDVLPGNAKLSYLPSHPETRSELAVPITWRGDHIGVLNLEHVQARALAPYTPFIEALATMAAFALYQNRQRKRELRIRDSEVVAGITEYATYVSHDLKKPFIKMRDAVRAMEPLNSVDSGKHIERMQAAIEDGLKSIADFGKSIPSAVNAVSRFSLHDVVRSAVEDAQALYNTTVFRLGQQRQSPTLIEASPQWIAWCVRNIIDNSVLYGARTIWLRTAEADGSVLCEIMDDGPGVPESQFDQLYSTEKTTLEVRGSGRALPFIKSYINSVEGGISSHRSPHGGLLTKLVMPSRSPGTAADLGANEYA